MRPAQHCPTGLVWLLSRHGGATTPHQNVRLATAVGEGALLSPPPFHPNAEFTTSQVTNSTRIGPSANTTTVARSASQTDFQKRGRSSIGSLVYVASLWLTHKGQRGGFAMTTAVLLWSQTQVTSDPACRISRASPASTSPSGGRCAQRASSRFFWATDNAEVRCHQF
jgi:hypothetical protein